MVGNGMGAKHGTMFKTAVSLEETGKTQIVALDKTGTITSGEPQVTDLVPADGVSEEELLKGAFALEHKSEHPLARAILALAEEKGLAREEVSVSLRFLETALWQNGTERARGGNRALITKKAVLSKQMEEQAAKLSEEGKTPLFFSEDGKMLGMIAVADVIKEDSPRAVKELQNMGIRVVMLTGDNERTARAIGAQAGVDEVIAGVLPDGKEAVISRLKEKGKVAMVGDGINDAPGSDQCGYRYCHRSRNRYRDRCGRRCPDEEPPLRCTGSDPLKPCDPQEHSREFVLGLHLQYHRYSAGCGRMDPAVRLEAEPDVRCGGDEPFEPLRCDKRPASESVSDARRVKR